MIAAIRAEFVKLFSVRSTYIIVVLTLLLICLTAGYIEGYQANSDSLANPLHLADSVVVDKIAIVAVLGAIIGLLQFSHEYRYNIIMHSLTTVNRRLKFLAAKIIASTIFSFLFLVLSVAVAILAALIGLKLGDHTLVSQSFPFADLVPRVLLYVWLYTMIALLFVALTRNQVFSMVGFLLFPSFIEPLLGLLLKGNAKYLPYTATEAVLSPNPALSHKTGAIVALSYVIGLWLIAAILFVKRDAN